MRIVDLNKLSEEERKKVLEEQQTMLEQRQQASAELQRQGNQKFNELVNKSGEYDTNKHTTTIGNIQNAYRGSSDYNNIKKSLNTFYRNNNTNSSLWEQIKERAGFTAKKTGAGILSGISGIGQGIITDTANNMKKGEKEDSNELIRNLVNSFSSQSPTDYMMKNLPNYAKKQIESLKDKDKNGIEKAVSFVNNAVSEVGNSYNNKLGVLSELVGKISPNTSEELLKANNKISEPINEINNQLDRESEKYGTVANTIANVGQAIGNMTPSILSSVITKNPNVGLATMGLSSKGQSTQEALNKGAELDKAVKIGNTKAMIEVGTEMLTGGVNIFGKGALDDIAEKGILSKVKSNVGKAISKQGINVAGETLEETISDILGTVIDKGTVNPNAKYTLKDWGDTAITTTLTTLVLNSLGIAGDIKSISNENKANKNAQNWINEAQNIINNNTTQNLQQNTVQNQSILPIQQITQQENKTAQNGYMEQILPTQNYYYEKSDNTKIDNLRKDANKYFNNSEKARNYVNMLEKIITDKDIDIRLDTNLKTPDGKIANGSYSNGVITINPNSTRTGEFIAIHELTHAIGTKDMLDMVNRYRESNAEFNSAVENLLQSYNTTELTEEALSDVSAQLFGNQEFINNIAQNNPNIFQKLYSEIKYLWHQFRGYKNQNQFVEDLYYKWTQAYNNNTTNSKKSSYSIQADGNGNKYVKVDTDQNIFDGINENDYNKIAKMYMQDYLKGNTILNKNDKATIGSKGINKYTNPTQQTKYLSEKMQLTPELKNVLEIAEKVEDSPPTKDTSKYPNWEYYKFKFELGGKNFEGLINIGVDKNGNKHFYEINKIHTTSSSYVSTNKSSSMDSINNSIAPTKNDVNTTTKYSIQESENNSGSFNLQKNRFDVSGNENLANAQTLFYRTRDDGQYYVQATDGSGKITYDGVFYGEKQLARSLGEEIANKIVNTSESTNNEIYLQSDNIKSETDYMMAHRPTETGAYASNITKGTGEWDSLMPEDVYEHPEWYFDMNQEYSKESFKVLKQIKNNPNAEITIYRATTGNKINKGDWVTLSKKYAEYHNNSQFKGKGNIIELKVKAKDVQYAGDDINEFGYFPQNDMQTIDNPDIRFSQNNETWQSYLDKNYKPTGRRTNLKDIKLPTKADIEAKVNLPTKENVNQPTQGEKIDWNTVERPEGKIRKHYRSIIESGNTTKEAKAIAKELMGMDTYIPDSNNKQLERADTRIQNSTPESELDSLMSRATTGGKIDATDIAVGEKLIQYYSLIGDKAKLQESIQATAMAGTTAGQAVQAMSLLNHQTPEGQAVWIQRSVEKMNNDLRKARGEKAQQFDFTAEMQEKIVNSKNNEELQDNLNDVYKELGQQVNKNLIEKIDSWRYFSMLGNPKTHIRNMVGNFLMGKAQDTKNKVAGVIEGTVAKFNTDMERMHTIKRASKEVTDFAKNDIKNVSDRLGLNDNKYNPKSRLENNMRTFKSDVMENTLGRLFKWNDNLLEAEDGLGLKAGYKKALSEYITANNIDVNNITDTQLSKARNYAVQQAQERTFHQANIIASAINSFFGKNKATKAIGDAVLPFVKTPANVAKTGIEYSPAGLAKSIVYDSVQLRKGNINVNQYIDNVSKGLTGSAITVLGFALAQAGILKASGSDDDKKEKFDEQSGKQAYSIQIGDNTYTIDWLAPVGIPLMVGAEIYEGLSQKSNEKKTKSSDDEDVTKQFWDRAEVLANSLSNTLDPMVEMSMISGLTSTVRSFAQGDTQALGNMLTNGAKSYINQFVPTLLGQIAKTTDIVERDTTSTKSGTISKAVDSTANQIKSKIPGLRQTLPTKKDIWGKDVTLANNWPQRFFEAGILPTNSKTINKDKVVTELNNLYDKIGESSILPTTIDKTFTIDGQKYRMTNEEYNKYKTNYGQTSYKLIKNLVSSEEYGKMNDKQKQKAIENVYSYAKENNKLDYAKNNKLECEQSTLYTTMQDLKNNGGSQSEYLNYLSKTTELNKDKDKNQILVDSNYTDKTKAIIYRNTTGKEDELYNNLLSKDNININEYLKYKLQEFESDRKDDGTTSGEAISGSKKKKVYSYVNNMNITREQKLILLGMQYKLSNSERTELANLINKLPNTSKDEKMKLYEKMQGFTVYKNGTIKW